MKCQPGHKKKWVIEERHHRWSSASTMSHVIAEKHRNTIENASCWRWSLSLLLQLLNDWALLEWLQVWNENYIQRKKGRPTWTFSNGRRLDRSPLDVHVCYPKFPSKSLPNSCGHPRASGFQSCSKDHCSSQYWCHIDVTTGVRWTLTTFCLFLSIIQKKIFQRWVSYGRNRFHSFLNLDFSSSKFRCFCS